MKLTALVGAQLFDGDLLLPAHALLLNDEQIVQIVEENAIPAQYQVVTLDGGTLAPGFIDLQVNGGGDVLLNNTPTSAAVQQMVAGHLKHGTTSIMPTLISDSPENIKRGVDAVQTAQAQGILSVLGVHIEGPFFSSEKKGVHLKSALRQPDQGDIDWLCQLPPLKVILTLAPERVSLDIIRQLAQVGITVCAGHTNARADQVNEALAAGIKGFTHLYNAMRPMQGREPGVVGAALSDPDSWAGIIADGHHVHRQAITVALKAKGQGKLYLVSDAMATVGGQLDSFPLYGEIIRVDGEHLINAEGRLAGSAVGLNQCVRYMVETVKVTLAEALKMASRYPAEFMNVDSYLGRLSEGYRADLVWLDDQFNVKDTWVAGQSQEHS